MKQSNTWRNYDVDKSQIEQLRGKVYEYASSHPDQVDMQDVRNRIASPDDVTNNNVDMNNNKCSDWMLKRFLISSHRDVDSALQKFVEFFSFRKQFEVYKLTSENVFPQEMFQLRALETVGCDKNNNKNFIIRLKYYKKLPQFEVFIKRGIVYLFEQLDLQYEQGLCDGVCMILDCQDFSVSNIDLDLLQFIVKQMTFSYSGIIRNMLIYEIPFLMNYVFKVVESWLPSVSDKDGSKRKFFFSVNKKNIAEYIDKDQRPEYLNGNLQIANEIPKTALPFIKIVQNVNVEEANAKKINDYLSQLCKNV